VKRSRKEGSKVRENRRGKPLRVGCKGGSEKFPKLEDEGGIGGGEEVGPKVIKEKRDAVG
jgi:hypothetical protein